MEGRIDLQFDAFRPYGVVIAWAIDAERVGPDRVAVERSFFLRGLYRAAHQAAQHHRLESEGLDRELEFLDRFFGRMHRDNAGRRDTVLELAEEVRDEHVAGAAGGAADFVVALERREQRDIRRIEHREIESDLVHPL